MFKTVKYKFILIPFFIMCILLLPEMVFSKQMPEIKVLYIGNSHSHNSIQYLPNIFSQCGYRSIVASCYKSNSNLKYNYNSAIKKKKNHNYQKYKKGKWHEVNAYSVADAITDESWDYIIIQNKVTDQADASTYYQERIAIGQSPNNVNILKNFTSYIRKHSSAKICWNTLWSLHTMQDFDFCNDWNNNSKKLYSSILETTKKEVYQHQIADCYIWSGPTIERLYASYLKDYIFSDGKHTSATFGNFCASMCLAKGLGMDISKVKKYSYQTTFSTKHIKNIRKAIQQAWRNPWKKNFQTKLLPPKIKATTKSKQIKNK